MKTRERAERRYKRRIDKRLDARIKRFWQEFKKYVESKEVKI